MSREKAPLPNHILYNNQINISRCLAIAMFCFSCQATRLADALLYYTHHYLYEIILWKLGNGLLRALAETNLMCTIQRLTYSLL